MSAAAIPVLAKARSLNAEVAADDGGKMPAIRGGPLLGEHDIVMGCRAERPGIVFLGGAMPKLEEADGDVAAEGIDVARGKRMSGPRRYHKPMDVLRRGGGFAAFDGLAANYVHAVRAINAVTVEDGVVEEDAAEVIREGDVRIEMEPPAVILEPGEAGVDGGAFVEVAPILREEVCLDADGAVLLRDGLSGAVRVRSDDDEGIEVGMIEGEGRVEEIVEADRYGDGLEAQGLDSLGRRNQGTGGKTGAGGV